MPFVVAAALVAASPEIFGASIGIGTLTLGTVTGYLLTTGATIGLQMALAAANQPKGKTQQGQVSVKNSNSNRIGACGRVKMGGAYFFNDAIGGFLLFTGIIHCQGPYRVKEWWYGDQLCAIPAGTNGGFVGINPWFTNVAITTLQGDDDQLANITLTSNFADWTDNHRLRGMANSVILASLPLKADKNFQKVFPDGNRELRTVGIAGEPTDPRTGLAIDVDANEALASNAALNILHEATRAYTDGRTGKSWSYMTLSRINTASWSAFADLCDEAVALADGTTEPRYRCDGYWDMGEAIGQRLSRMMQCCDARWMPLPDGTVGIVGGRWIEPEVTLTEDDFINYTYTPGLDITARYNQLPWQFTDPLNDDQVVAGDPWDDHDAQARDGRIITRKSALDLSMVQSHSQGRRIAKIVCARENPEHILSGCILRAPIRLTGQIVVRIVLATFGLDETFEIKACQPAGNYVTASMEFHSVSQDMFAWNPTAEEGARPAYPSSTVGTIILVPNPAGIELTLQRTELSAGVYGVQVIASAAPPTDDAAQYWALVGRIKTDGTSDDTYLPMSPYNSNSVISDFRDDGELVDVELSWVGLGQTSAWSSPQEIGITADATAPNPPTGFTGTGGSGTATLSWTSSASANAVSVQVYRGATTLFGDALPVGSPIYGSPNQAMTRTYAGLAAGTYRYWLRARNGSGVLSSVVGPQTVTVT